ncbi:TonB-dependent receptor [Sphingomonas sp. BAUL-RG-20F-R05-02]|uniref:TonB-dependent receptor n=1 Tax=Sphingomonas sp. BAUL-RG-20F-R05-02 TaxID=2914830 RepID=UPI001F58F4B8|nr:TonB-dependent receptor [Sphingomonas sp. BAUL-RG-20F-R05-02]
MTSVLLVTTALVPLTAARAQRASPPSSAPSTTPPTSVIEVPQPPAGTPNDTGIADVIVTARRFAENLQTTPVAVTALSDRNLEVAQVQNAIDLQRTTPSLSVLNGGPSVSGLTFVAIRGQQQSNPGTANDPAVGIYVDGVYIPRPSQGQTDINDIDRLEVLRGPQGTLFGRNTTGGALNILTAQPKDVFELSAKAETGNYAYKSFSGTVNVPLADNLAARFTGSYRDHDGYARDDALGRDIANNRSYFGRGKIRYEGAGFDITLSGDYNHINDNGQKNVLVAYNPAVFGALPGGAAANAQLAQYLLNDNNWYSSNGTGYVVPTNSAAFNALPADVRALYSRQPQNEVTAYGAGAVVNVDLGFAKLKSITGYRYSNATGLIDTDGTPVQILTTTSGYGSHQISEEVQLSGDLTPKFSYILGGYYGHEKGYESSRSQTFGFLPIARLITENYADVINDSAGVFAQGYYKLTDKLRFTGGVRWTFDTREVILHNKTVYGNPATCSNPKNDAGQICSQTQEAHFSYPAWTGVVDYQATDKIFVYAKTSGAANSGGFNTRQGSLPAFQPEKVQDVELGLKAKWLDNRLRTNLAVFQSWQSGVQRNKSIVIPGTTTPSQFLVNAGNAHIHGIELEVTAVPWHGMELNGNMSLMDGGYNKGSFTDTQVVNGATVTVDRSGEPLPQLPKRQFNIGATQTLPVGSNSLQLHADYSYISKIWFYPLTAAAGQPAAVVALYNTNNQFSFAKGYGLLNGRVSFQLKNPDIEIAVFGKNILQKHYAERVFSEVYTAGLGFIQQTQGDPRTYGVSVSYHFGG